MPAAVGDDKGGEVSEMKSIRISIIILACLLSVSVYASGIVGTGSTGEDSVAISIFITDSLGNPARTHADSFFVHVIGPAGDSITGLAGVAASSNLHIDSMQTALAGWTYVYAEAVNVIDGDGRAGTYELCFCAKDTDPGFVDCVRRTFQVAESHLSSQLASITTILDSVLAVLDTVQNQDNWVSSFDPTVDVVSSDVVEISGDAGAADDFESMLDGSGGARLTLAGVEIRAQGSDTAVIIEADVTGTAPGMYIIGGGNGGEGVKIVGGNTKSALVAQAGASLGATHGFDLIGDGAGAGLNASLGTSAKQSIADAVWDEDTAGHATSGSFATMLKDTSAYQGSASGLTAAEVADSVWDELQNGHTAAGSFGSYLDAPVSGAGSPLGGGTYPFTIVAYDSSSGQAVPGVRMYAYDESVSVLMAQGATAPDGRVAFNLDADQYVLSAFAPGYIFTAYDTIDVAGVGIDSVCGYRFDPGNPSSPNLCRVYGFIYGVDGRPVEGVTVSAEITGGVVRYNSLIVSPYRQTATSDTAGYFYFDLIPSDDLNPSGTSYLVTASSASGTILNAQIVVPHSSDWQLDW